MPKDNVNKWFENEVEAPKWFETEDKSEKKPEKSILTGTGVVRCLNLNNEICNSRFKNNLYIGSLCDLLTAEGMYDSILNFWTPEKKEETYEKACYTKSGILKETEVVTRLHKNGFTDSKNKKYKQRRIFIEEFGWAGYSDCILDINTLIYYGKKTTPKEKPEKKEYRVVEIKETSVNNYKLWTSVDQLPINYQGQASVYLDYFYKEKIVKSDIGHYLIFVRDNPKTCRPLDFKVNKELIRLLEEKSNIFWAHIRSRTVPEGFKKPSEKDFEGWIKLGNEHNREWNKLSGLENV